MPTAWFLLRLLVTFSVGSDLYTAPAPGTPPSLPPARLGGRPLATCAPATCLGCCAPAPAACRLCAAFLPWRRPHLPSTLTAPCLASRFFTHGRLYPSGAGGFRRQVRFSSISALPRASAMYHPDCNVASPLWLATGRDGRRLRTRRLRLRTTCRRVASSIPGPPPAIPRLILLPSTASLPHTVRQTAALRRPELDLCVGWLCAAVMYLIVPYILPHSGQYSG